MLLLLISIFIVYGSAIFATGFTAILKEGVMMSVRVGSRILSSAYSRMDLWLIGSGRLVEGSLLLDILSESD